MRIGPESADSLVESSLSIAACLLAFCCYLLTGTVVMQLYAVVCCDYHMCSIKFAYYYYVQNNDRPFLNGIAFASLLYYLGRMLNCFKLDSEQLAMLLNIATLTSSATDTTLAGG